MGIPDTRGPKQSLQSTFQYSGRGTKDSAKRPENQGHASSARPSPLLKRVIYSIWIPRRHARKIRQAGVEPLQHVLPVDAGLDVADALRLAPVQGLVGLEA